MIVIWNANADMLERHQREAVEAFGGLPPDLQSALSLEGDTIVYRGRHVGRLVDQLEIDLDAVKGGEA